MWLNEFCCRFSFSRYSPLFHFVRLLACSRVKRSYHFYCCLPECWYIMLFYALFCVILRLLAIVYRCFVVKSACAHPQRCHTSAEKKWTSSSFVQTTNVNCLYTDSSLFKSILSTIFCCAREKSCGEMPKPPAKQWMMIFLFDYKLCDQNDKPNIFTLFASQQLVLHSACALRFSGFTQTYGLNSQWKHKWCFVILMLINNSQR